MPYIPHVACFARAELPSLTSTVMSVLADLKSEAATRPQTDVVPPSAVLPDIEHAAVADDPRAWSKARKVCIVRRSFLGIHRGDGDVVSILSSVQMEMLTLSSTLVDGGYDHLCR